MVGTLCPACDGKRLKKEALSVTFAGVDIGTLGQMPLDAVAELLAPAARGELEAADPPRRGGRRIGGARTARPTSPGASPPAARPMRARPTCVARPISPKRSGSRPSASPSTSKRGSRRCARSASATSRSTAARRPSRPASCSGCRLATQIRSNLFGVVYVLDEPTAGLHPSDSEALMRALEELRRAGNSLFVVEHDLETMRRADWLVDVGPDAGERGGRVLYSGPPAGLAEVAGRTPPATCSPGPSRRAATPHAAGLARAARHHPQ